MIIALILILFAVALFLIFHDDHDDSYTRREKGPGGKAPKSVYQKKEHSRPAAPKSLYTQEVPRTQGTPRPQEAPRPVSPKASREPRKPLDFHFLDDIDYDPALPERTMSSYIAGVQAYCTDDDLGGIVGYVYINPSPEAYEVHAADGRLLGFLPMKDRIAYQVFNPSRVVCPFAGHVAISTTGRLYADIRIVLPSSRDFVEQSLTGFLGY
jgi:hypothetical protein